MRKPPRKHARGRERSERKKARATKAAKPPKEVKPPEGTRPIVPVVGVGASAGGLEAFSQILEALGDDAGVAIVFVQHLAPLHESALPVLLAGRTHMPVEQVAEGATVEANAVYVIPPNVQMELRDGALHLSPRPGNHTQYTPIDFFFRSLAEAAESAAIGVILSGSSSDGTVGLREIKAAGGITIAQDPKTARYDMMPRAAIDGDAIDLVLSPTAIAEEIRRIGRHVSVRRPRSAATREEFSLGEEELRRLIALLGKASGMDFTYYKVPTIQRRVRRHMASRKLTDVGEYLRYLESTPNEAQSLAQDILIHVTRFFRDPESFAALAEEVFPVMMANRPSDTPIRLWVAGCSTGEEAYSLAIALLEFLGDQAATTPIQIFATDASEGAIESARGGLYPESIAADVSAERLRRFFTKVDGKYKIAKAVRDLCVFARQDLTRDPPFSRLDLVVCRNVLIFLGPVLQKKLLSVFSYALKQSGFLMLGPAEALPPGNESFLVVNKKQRIFRRGPRARANAAAFPLHYNEPLAAAKERRIGPVTPSPSVQHEAQRALLERYAPPGAVVDENLHIVQFLGRTGRFLEPSPGDASLGLLKMVREGLLHGVRTAFQEARREGRTARRGGLRFRGDGREVEVTVEVMPLGSGAAAGRHFAVLFVERAPAQPPPRSRGRGKRRGAPADPRISKLEEELGASRDYLQSIIQELEAANEELQSANEEILSSNEELQSANEELDTAKEELQSTNEELNTVNEELQGRNEELSRVNSDLVNLLASVQVALVIVDSNLSIHRLTPMAERVLNLIPSDVGRPISHIQPNIDCPDLEQRIREVIETVLPYEAEVRDRQGRWFSLHIRPYKDVDNRIDGAVLALYDVDLLKRHEAELRSARDYAEAIVQTVRDGLVVLDGNLRVQSLNKAFCDIFRVSANDLIGQIFYETNHGQWNIPQLRSLLDKVLSEGKPIERFDVEHDFAMIGRRVMRLNARRVQNAEGMPELILLAIEDVTGRAT